MSYQIRKMTEDDLDAVRILDQRAFSAQYPGVLPRTKLNLLASLALDPQGAFAAVDKNNQVFGFIFAKTHGKIGWIGTFGVDSSIVGAGVGKALLDVSLNYLKSLNCSLIGLSTNPSSGYNMGLYLKKNFVLTLPTLYLKKKLQKKINLNPACMKPIENYEKVRQISQSLSADLDYSSIYLSNQKYQWLRCLKFEMENVSGLAFIADDLPRPSQEKMARLYAGCLNNKTIEACMAYFEALEQYCFDIGFEKLLISMDSKNNEILKSVIESGYQVITSSARFFHENRSYHLEGIEFCNWAM